MQLALVTMALLLGGAHGWLGRDVILKEESLPEDNGYF